MSQRTEQSTMKRVSHKRLFSQVYVRVSRADDCFLRLSFYRHLHLHISTGRMWRADLAIIIQGARRNYSRSPSWFPPTESANRLIRNLSFEREIAVIYSRKEALHRLRRGSTCCYLRFRYALSFPWLTIGLLRPLASYLDFSDVANPTTRRISRLVVSRWLDFRWIPANLGSAFYFACSLAVRFGLQMP